MKRRAFLTALGGAAAWPLTARGQQPAMAVWICTQRIAQLFRTDGSCVQPRSKGGRIYRRPECFDRISLAEGHYERLSVLVADLINRMADVIFAAGGTDPAKVAKAATTKIPIVFVSAADPVKTGLVASLSRPGGNVTGVSLLASASPPKRSCVPFRTATRC